MKNATKVAILLETMLIACAVFLISLGSPLGVVAFAGAGIFAIAHVGDKYEKQISEWLRK